MFSSKDEEGVLTSSLLNQIIGTGPNIKWSSGSNRLQLAAQSVASSSCLVSNFFYFSNKNSISFERYHRLIFIMLNRVYLVFILFRIKMIQIKLLKLFIKN